MSERPLYTVVDWDIHFETYESKRVAKACTWVAMPNKHDGRSYRRLTREPNPAALYGAWAALTQVASKCPIRGVLADLDGPLDATDLEDKTGLPAEEFARIFHFATSDRVRWLTATPDPDRIAEVMAAIRRKKDGSSRSGPQIPAEPASRPQIPADSAPHPQLPADTRSAPHDSAPHACAQAYRTVPDRTGPDSTLPPAGGSEDSTSPSATLEATEHFLISLFAKGEKKRARLNDVGRRSLAQWKAHLPLTPAQEAMLRWFYGLPNPDNSDFDLKIRKKTAEALADALLSEVERAEAYAEKTPGSAGAHTQRQPAPAEPPGWREWLAATYPTASHPPRFADLPESVRSEFQLAHS